MTIYILLLIIISFFLIFQGVLALFQMIYGWIDAEMLEKNTMPINFHDKKTFFSIIVPVRLEKGVIGKTLMHLLSQKYPGDKFEILVPMYYGDETIAEVKEIAEKTSKVSVRPIIFSDGPINKAHSLNTALKETKGTYIAVFDAEDEVDKNLLEYVNVLIHTEGKKIFQTGVSLINWGSNWYGVHAVLEYFFWFNSRLHWYAKKGVVPLGGVGAFIPKEDLLAVGGWDENSLTEDANLGLDLSVKGYPFRILAQEEYSVKEEVPPSVIGFVKQRTRWIQGFLQIIMDKNWLKLSRGNRINLLFLIFFPFVQTSLMIWFLASLFFVPKLPLLFVLLSEIPLGILIFQIAISMAGSMEMLRIRKSLKLFPVFLIIYVITFVPYQLLIATAAVRAVIRQAKGATNWEKTKHFNKNRKELLGVNAISFYE